MIQVRFSYPSDEAWLAWRKKCTKETGSMLTDGCPEKFNDDLYKQQRSTLLRLFHNKCAYCESYVGGDQPGDVDHFRPKGRIQIDVASAPRYLPGYYWLAYEARNLLIACDMCNRSFKREKFPILDEACRARKPGEELKEQPSLFDPTIDEPSQHLVFSPVTGALAARDSDLRGQATIDTLGLNRETLMNLRKNAYRQTRLNLNALLTHWISGGEFSDHSLQELHKVKSGDAEYALACRWACRDLGGSLETLFETLKPLTRLVE
jgi:uncharacterized protein (TIGR02646 family)